MSNLKDFRQGYDHCLVTIQTKAHELGVNFPWLDEEVEKRKAIQYKGPMLVEEIDAIYAETSKKDLEILLLAVAAALKDAFGFGIKRYTRFFTQFVLATVYMHKKWADVYDFQKELEKQVGPEITDLIYKSTYPDLKQPQPADVYSDVDLVDRTEWNEVLEALKFTEQKNPNGLDCFDIYDDRGNWFIQYEGEIEKAKAFNILEGVCWGKIHEWEEKKKEPQPQQSPQPKQPQTTKKRRRKKR